MLKHPAQMRMMEAMVVEASRWKSLVINIGNIFNISNKKKSKNRNNLDDEHCKEVPEAAPQDHRCDKVGGGEEAGDEDSENSW